MICPFCKHEEPQEVFIQANACPACGYALDNFYSEDEDDSWLEYEYRTETENIP